MNIGDIKEITWADQTTAQVKLIAIESYSVFPPDYWFEYEKDETNRQLIHPDFGKEDYIKSSILLAEDWLPHFFKN